MTETERGCGYRKIGGAYLSGIGLGVPCDALPLPLEDCPTCGFSVPFSRAMQIIHRGYIVGAINEKHFLSGIPSGCRDNYPCPICTLEFGDTFALMYVSHNYYTEVSFLAEAKLQGVSKRIAPESIPKKFRIGETWVFLAMKKNREDQGRIFYAFKPSTIEVPLWKDLQGTGFKWFGMTEAEMTAKGYSPVWIERNPENIKKHGIGLHLDRP